MADWLASCGLRKAEAKKFARPLVLEQNVGSVKKAVSMHKRGKLEAALVAAGIDEDNIALILDDLSSSA